jgi:energy-coupling factor transporter ATP-binding protein EcfA2
LEQVVEDPEVIAEKERVQTGAADDSPVVIVGLHKQYEVGFKLSDFVDGKWRRPASKRNKVAIKELWLALSKNECFGLLGPVSNSIPVSTQRTLVLIPFDSCWQNGAGKTTTISILTGLFPPTAGTAYVGGFDIRTNMDDVHQIMSVCPQFDTFWEELTVMETLLFYARLKGVPAQFEQQSVRKTISSIGLALWADRLARDLSGGMKRRLSLGISLVGDPTAIFLDEPTT